MTEQTTETKPGISAGIVVHEGRVLMVRRRVKEGELSWQFPAGAIEAGETAEQAAVRETDEETGLTVEAVKLLGERVHPKTGRSMSYTACTVLAGEAHVADADELDAVAWITLDEIPEYVPYGLFEPVQEFLNRELPIWQNPELAASIRRAYEQAEQGKTVDRGDLSSAAGYEEFAEVRGAEDEEHEQAMRGRRRGRED